MIKIGIPNKGRLNKESIELLQKAGFKIQTLQRELSQICKNYEMKILFSRASDIPMLLEKGALDLGITGLDFIIEENVQADKLLRLEFGKGKIILAAPEGKTLDDFNGKVLKIATSYPNIARKYCAEKGIQSEIVSMNGAVELSPKMGIAEMIIDLSSTGVTLEKNGLNILEEIVETQACLFASRQENKEKQKQIQKVVTAIRSVFLAREKKFLLANIPKKSLLETQKIVPGINGATVMSIANDPSLCSIQVIVCEKDIAKTIASLQNLGATGILLMNLERIIP